MNFPPDPYRRSESILKIMKRYQEASSDDHFHDSFHLVRRYLNVGSL